MMMFFLVLMSFIWSMKSYHFFSIYFSQDKIFLLFFPLMMFYLIFYKEIKFIEKTTTDTLTMSLCNMMIFLPLIMLFCSQSMLVMFLMFEMVMLPTCILVINYGNTYDKMKSVLWMIFLNMLGSIPFMFFMYATIDMAHTLSFVSLYSNYWAMQEMSIILYTSCNIMFFFKLPFMFFHYWLTMVHVSASTFSSMFLAGALLKMPILGMTKISVIMDYISFNITPILYSICLMCLTMFSIFMLRTNDLKYIIALSSVLHMSLIPFNTMKMSEMGFISSMFMGMGHGIVSPCLFMMCGLFYEISSSRSLNFVKFIMSSSKLMVYFFILMMLLNFGIPPFLCFISELMFMLESCLTSLASTMLIMLFLCLNCILLIFIISLMFSKMKMMFVSTQMFMNKFMMCIFYSMFMYISMFFLY